MLTNRAKVFCGVAFMLGCSDFRDPVGIAPPNKPATHVAIDGQSVVRSGVGTPTIDGAFSPGEWANAGTVNFAANLPLALGGGTAPAALYVLNDAKNLYLAVRITRPALETTGVALEFDNTHAAGFEPNEGDDAIGLNLYPGGGLFFFDDFRTTKPPCPVGMLCGLYDTDVGGTIDGGGAGSNDGTFTYAELWHPLDSSDDLHDFSLKPGDVVGFHFSLRLIHGSLRDTELPTASYAPINRADLEIAIPEIPISIDVKPGSAVNTLNLKSKGKTPVAILGSSTFDATTVDPATVRLSGAPIAERPDGTRMAERVDVNGDGRPDLLVHVLTAELQLGGGLVEAVLTGKTLGGESIRGSDWVTVVPGDR